MKGDMQIERRDKGTFRRNKKVFVHRLTLAALRAEGFKISTLLKRPRSAPAPAQ